MNKNLTIQEKYSQHWPVIAGISLVIAGLLLISYQLSENVLWLGYLRLASFAFFAIGLLSLLKIRDGRVEITVSVNEVVIKAEYKIRGSKVYTEEWKISGIRELKVDKMPNKSIYNDFMKSDSCIRIRKKDEKAWIYFNRLNHRVIPLSKENATILHEFLEEAVQA